MVNIKPVFLLTGLVAPTMVARGSGAIVNIGSINALLGMNGSALYGMNQGGRPLAHEVLGCGVRAARGSSQHRCSRADADHPQ